jgi:hypothetical protein
VGESANQLAADAFSTTSVLDASYGAQLAGELSAYAAADAVLAVSDKEADLINDFTGESGLAHTVRLIAELEQSTVPFRRRRGILTVGSFEHPPNGLAVKFLCHDILPRLDPKLLEEHPVSVVGAGLNDTVRGHARDLQHVRMTGWVPSVLPYLERSRITVVPLTYGAGAKGKVIEALMAGTPTVSTGIGVEGLALTDREHVLVADDAATFADAMSQLLTDAPLWRRLARYGRDHAESAHGRAQAAEAFLRVVDRVLSTEPKAGRLLEPAKDQYRNRLDYQYFHKVMTSLRAVVTNKVPHDATLAVITGREEWLLELGNRVVWRVPDPDDTATATGKTRGEVAVEDLEELRSRGAQFLVIPSRALWWLEHYSELKEYLDRQYHAVIFDTSTCAIYALEPPSAGEASGLESPTDRNPQIAALEPNPSASSEASPGSAVKLIAFYLPQFHPIPENDAWWEEGFTEWTNVVKARPQFPGHLQPHLPSDLGFYDLRSHEARQAQADLARAYGIHGFCYYHYWFGGKRLLERPFNDVLASGEPNLPFCLCWANEPWSRRWNGSSEDVLQAQTYSSEDDEAHMTFLLPALRDPRAITVEGKPMFLVYQARELPDPARTTALWRRMVADAGLDGIHLVAVETGWDAGWDATEVGFDAKVLFQPQFSMLRTLEKIPVSGKESLAVYDYDSAWPTLVNPEPVSYARYDTVFPSWDNSPRTGERSVVLHNATPASYERWLGEAIARAGRREGDHRLVFINAWNEWGEGCHLEPDRHHGQAFLEATQRALANAERLDVRPAVPGTAVGASTKRRGRSDAAPHRSRRRKRP